MDNREPPYLRWARESQNRIKELFNKWIKILNLENSEVNLRILSFNKSIQLQNSGWRALCHWNKTTNIWDIIVPFNIETVILIHELGHLYFPKKLGDMRLAPAMENRGLHKEIMNCLNSLEDWFVNYYLTKYEEFYKLWFHLKQNDLNYIIKEKYELYSILAYYLKHYIEYNYLFNETVKYKTQIDNFIEETEKIIISKSKIYDNNKLNQLKKLLSKFELYKDCKNPEKIISYMEDVLRELSLWSNKTIKEQFKLRFKKI